MLISATLSKPASNIQEVLGKQYEKIKIRAQASAAGSSYFVEMFTSTQVFHQHFTEEQALKFINDNAGTTFKNCVQKTDAEEITILANKKGKITRLVKKADAKVPSKNLVLPSGRQKNYLLQEGTQIPFLQLLGIMNSNGKVLAQKFDKFKQINRFLEFINDVIPSLQKLCGNFDETRPLRIADFGCGKSYLTFAVHFFLTEIRHIPCQIEGLDLKEDVINYCNDITQKLGLKGLVFHTGNIADYSGKNAPDLVITLHACDTATDFALEYAVQKDAKAILSVPCCQHQLNAQLKAQSGGTLFEPLLKHGLLKERFSALLTDAVRAQWLETKGYNVQLLEFIDMEHTPKNLLIRAVKTGSTKQQENELLKLLGCEQELWKK